ncbi:DUF4246 family protein [Streptomyces sp. cmx-4-7]|uniref:DUF4246 family protein n=1 Tax=Streptomyces sp. cmx-4-7 TaxID=2790939 RepID=UPI00397F4209
MRRVDRHARGNPARTRAYSWPRTPSVAGSGSRIRRRTVPATARRPERVRPGRPARPRPPGRRRARHRPPHPGRARVRRRHRVGSFRLADPTRPGHRRFLAFFLVDPSRRIVSTSDVRRAAVAALVRDLDDGARTVRGVREQLMRKRKFFVDEHNEQLHEREFSLCEH